MLEPDACSSMIFVDEGRMFHQLLDHIKRFPDDTPILMLAMLPFCGLTVHDGIKFANKLTPYKVPYDTQSVNRMRNYSKSLSDTGISVEEYAESVQQITGAFSSKMKSHTGLFASVLNAIQPDAGIFFYENKPIVTTYTTSRYIGIDGMFDHGVRESLGYDLGQAAAISYAVAEALGMNPDAYTSKRFETQGIDCQYAPLIKPLTDEGLAFQTCFFMLSEILMQMNSIDALRKAGIFSDILYVKFGTSTLVAASKSISKLRDYLGKSPESFSCTTQGISALSNIIPRKTRKRIRKIVKLRNALVHYDFQGFIGQQSCHGKSPDEILNYGAEASGFESSESYLNWLNTTICCCEERIAGLLKLPTV